MNAGVSGNLVGRFENGSGAMVETLVRMQTALESAGVVFIPADHTGGPGVRLREAPAAKAKRSRSGAQKKTSFLYRGFEASHVTSLPELSEQISCFSK
jgi:hypothetical protein